MALRLGERERVIEIQDADSENDEITEAEQPAVDVEIQRNSAKHKRLS
jgi:hypothetical protein